MRQEPIRLLYVGNHAGYFLSHRLPVMQALKDRGYEVHVAVPDNADALEQMITSDAVAAIKQLGFIFHPIPINRRGLNLINELRSILSLYHLYRHIKPHLVYHATIKPVVYGGVAARFARVPAVINAMTGLGYVFTDDSLKAKMIRACFSALYRFVMGHSSTVALFQNHDDQQTLITAGLVRENQTAVIFGSGVDMNKYHPVSNHTDTPIVMLVSRMLWDKGIGEFVQAAERCLQNGIQARFVLIGDTDPGNPSAIPREQLQAWDDSHRVEWRGWLKDTASALQEAVIFCLPSYYREGIPKALIEAAATGLPLISTDMPGCREIVRQDQNGLLVPPRNVDALVATLSEMLTNPERRAQMGRASREIAVNEFSVEKITGLTIELCETLLKSSA